MNATKRPSPKMLVPVFVAANLARCSEDEIWDLLSAEKIVGERIKGKIYVDLEAVTEAVKTERG